MSEYGDLILKVFHKNNFTYTSGMTWENLLRIATQEDDEESRELLQKFDKELIKKMQEHIYGTPNQNGPNRNAAKDKKKPKDARDDMIVDPVSPLCDTCEKKRDIIMENVIRKSQLTQGFNSNKELLHALP